MIVLSSISNSSTSHLFRGWGGSWLVGVGGFLLLLGLVEFNMRLDGWQPSLPDSPLLWSRQRERASELGEQAFIIIGASRSQLGISTELIGYRTGFEPVQLSIDGASFIPVLKDLAEDKRITGKVLVSYSAATLLFNDKKDRSVDWLAYYHNQYLAKDNPPYAIVDERIENWLISQLATRLTGARPLTTLLSWLSTRDSSSGNYLMMLPDRSRMADYSKVTMPDFYLQRVARSLGRSYSDDRKVMSNQTLQEFYRKLADSLQMAPDSGLIEASSRIQQYIAAIEERGGEVTLIHFPVDKLVARVLAARYPRNRYWDVVIGTHPRAIHFRDYASLTGIDLPDGSHIDKSDRERVTEAILDIMRK